MESASPSASLNWNLRTQEDAVQHFHLTDFSLTTLDGHVESILLPSGGNDGTYYILSGNLMSPHNTSIREHYKIKVRTYYIDVGTTTGGEDVNQGFWMTGDDADMRFKLVYPAAPEYADYAMGILYLAGERKLFQNYEFPYDSGTCFQMTNFILTDQKLGMPQTLILPKDSTALFVLQGHVKRNREAMQVDEQVQLSPYGDYSALCLRTYITNKYLVDFGREVVHQEPQIWVQDNLDRWIKLVGPCHRDYKLDYDTAMRQTINNVKGYNWKAEEEQIWRHVTNFKLTTEAGELHPLEITALNSVFILWGDLCAPPGSSCPTIPIKVYVKDFSLDLGRMSGDPDQGMWMRDLQSVDNWYKLEAPALPEYRPFADPIFYKTAKFLELYDALIFQDCSMEYTHEDENDRYYCTGKIKDIYRVADPKFDLEFVKNNVDFIYNYLDFDLGKSTILLDSIEWLRLEDYGRQQIVSPAITLPATGGASSAAAQLNAGAGTGAGTGTLIGTAAGSVGAGLKSVLASNGTKTTANSDAKEKAKAVKDDAKAKAEKAKAIEVKDKKRKLDEVAATATAAEAAKEAAAAKARKVASVLAASAANTNTTGTSSAVAAASSAVASTAPSTPAVTTAKPIKKKQLLELDSPEAVSEVASAPLPLSVRNDNVGGAAGPVTVKSTAPYPAYAGEETAVNENSAALVKKSMPDAQTATVRTAKVLGEGLSAAQATAASLGTRTLAAPTEPVIPYSRAGQERAPEAVGQKRDRSLEPGEADDPTSSKRPAYDDRARDWEQSEASRDRTSPRNFDADDGRYSNDRRYGESSSRDRKPVGDQDKYARSDSRDRSADRWVGGSNPIRSRGDEPAGAGESRVICHYCRSTRKAFKCRIPRHKDGQYLTPRYGVYASESNNYRGAEAPAHSSYRAPPQASVTAASRSSTDADRDTDPSTDNRESGGTRTAPTVLQAPPPAQSSAPYSNGSGPAPLQISTPQSNVSTVQPQFSPVDPAETGADEDFGSRTKFVASIRNEMELERAKYEKKHQLHQLQSQAASAAQSMAASAADTLGFLHRLQSVNSKPTATKWGQGLKSVPSRPLPASTGSSSAGLPVVEVVPLGNRELDPKMRLKLTNMNTAGVYSIVQGTSPRASAVSAESAFVPVPVAPVDLTLKPAKSNLRDSSKPKKGGVSWPDAVGGLLSRVLVFEKVPYVLEGDNGVAPDS